MLSMLSPKSSVFNASNSPFRCAKPLISVVHTGVKSAGCENITIHLSLAKSENFIFPFVVTASKSGAISPILGIGFT